MRNASSRRSRRFAADRFADGRSGCGTSLALFFLLSCFFAGPAVSAKQGRRSAPLPEEEFASYVYDGDTVRVRLADGKEEKVRLIGIDAPELDDRRDAVHFMAEMAKRAAAIALSRRPVRLEYDWELRDKYGRLLAFVWTDEAGLVNEFLVREGFAAVMTAFSYRKDYRERFRKAERLAREEEKGLWRREPSAAVEESDALREQGRIASVRFLCRDLRQTRDLVILEGESGRFRAVIPRREAGAFAGLEAFPGQRLVVQGLVEERPPGCEIRLFDPYQLTKDAEEENAGPPERRDGSRVRPARPPTSGSLSYS